MGFEGESQSIKMERILKKLKKKKKKKDHRGGGPSVREETNALDSKS